MPIRILHDRQRTFGIGRTLTALCASFVLQFVFISNATAQTFNDVPANYWAASFIEIVAGVGISAGCGGGNYCPGDAVTRAQMAVFLERGMSGSSYVPPAATGNVFLDVGAGDFAANFIEKLSQDGITAGCGNGNFCPDDVVTRDQMAVFLLRAKYGSNYSPPAPSGVFNDVDSGHWAVAWIEQLAAEGVTAGCGNGNYCPDEPVQRDQMAVFLVRTFNLSMPDEGTYVGPVARDIDVLRFQQEFWSNARASDRCGNCHNESVGQEPMFVRNDDVNMAYDEALTVVDTDQPSLSAIVTKVSSPPSGHNCWVADPGVCGSIMTTWIENWVNGGAAYVLNGIATDTPLAHADISATVYEAGSDGSSSTVFITTADALGAFSLVVTTQNADDLVVLTAEGKNSQQGAKLISYVGSSALIGSVGPGGSSLVSVSDYGALEISHVSTAMAVLAEKANGGPIVNAADLPVAQSKVASAELLSMASAIKAFVDNAEVTLPAGVDNTLDLVRDPFEFSGFLADVETNYVQQLADATLGVADLLNQEFSATDVPGTTYLVARDDVPRYTSGSALRLNAGSSGDVVLHNGRSDVIWSIDNDGRLLIDLLNPPQEESFPINPDPNGQDPQVRALVSTDRITISRLGHGVAVDQVLALQTVVTTYPDNPELPGTIAEETIDGTRIFMAFRADEASPFTSGDISGATIAASYYHEGNNSTTTIDPQFGTELLTFNANGSGITARRLLTFVWTIDGDGALAIRFANGDESKIVRYSQDNIVSHTVVVGDLASGTTKMSNSELIEDDGASEFTDAMLQDRRYRSVPSMFEPDFDFDFLYFAGGSGCRIVAQPQGDSFADIDWWSTGANTLDSYRYISFEPAIPLQRRAWELIAIEPGLFGDRYWVIENLETNGDLDPAFPWLDPATTPGRMNAYEFIQDLAGQSNPCP